MVGIYTDDPYIPINPYMDTIILCIYIRIIHCIMLPASRQRSPELVSVSLPADFRGRLYSCGFFKIFTHHLRFGDSKIIIMYKT